MSGRRTETSQARTRGGTGPPLWGFENSGGAVHAARSLRVAVAIVVRGRARVAREVLGQRDLAVIVAVKDLVIDAGARRTTG